MGNDSSHGSNPAHSFASFGASTVVHVILLLALALMFTTENSPDIHLPLQISTVEEDFEVDLDDLQPVEVVVTELDEKQDFETESPALVPEPDAEVVRMDLKLDQAVEGISGGLAADADGGWGAIGESDLVMNFGDGDGDGEFAMEGDAAIDFFGVKASGRRFVFVTDCSGSMAGYPLEQLKAQLRASIGELPAEAEFFVVFFNHGAIPMPAANCVRATPANKTQYLAWVDAVMSDGGTDPSQAMIGALNLKPSVIFLLTDGEFAPEPTLLAISQLNRLRRIKINTIAIGNRMAEPLLQRIAEENHGVYKFVAF